MTLLKKLQDLAPWHHNVNLKDDLWTVAGNSQDYINPDAKNISVVNAEHLQKYLLRFYPNGLQGKSLLDVGCNGGGYCVMANRLDANFVLGFDPREHWINQANFLKNYFQIPDHRLKFETNTIDGILPQLDKFDVTLFMGVLYHLPYPIKTLIDLCAKTKETIIIDTAIRNDIPEDCMAPKIEAVEPFMSGVDGLSWYPGGPAILKRILLLCGFEFIKVTRLIKDTSSIDQRKYRTVTKLGRMRMIASRNDNIMSLGDST
jgi:SAM-dependent methyltransferase